jgi:hypothetical protein
MTLIGYAATELLPATASALAIAVTAEAESTMTRSTHAPMRDSAGAATESFPG